MIDSTPTGRAGPPSIPPVPDAIDPPLGSQPIDPLTQAAIDIDHRCDDFESLFRRGAAPRIEDALASAPEAIRRGLLLELVALEINLLTSIGVVHSPLDYVNRFPDFDDDLRQLVVNPNAVVLSDSEAAAPGDLTVEGTLPQPSQIKHFQLEAIIGQGGNGVVWQAFDMNLQRRVAVKLPRPDRTHDSIFSLMLREARAAAGLKHPNIVPVYEVGDGIEESSCYIVTGLIDGPSLKTWLGDNKPTPEQAARMLIKICRALAHAHANKVIHRDLKPGNILVDPTGEPYLADFGLAKVVSLDESISQMGYLIGTPLYMSPEQARGDHDAVDHRADIYSAGVLLYVMLVGKPPFLGDLPWLLQQIRDAAPPPPSLLNRAVPSDLEKICLKCLAKAPVHRYWSANDLADDLERFLLGETLRGVPVPLPNRVGKWAWRHRAAIVGAAAAVCLTALVALGAIQWSIPRQARETALVETVPPGCRITTVMLDPVTGEPDPGKLQTALGTTPLEVSLPPGDYLVVAVLDDLRFHEVFRHVPSKEEKIPFVGPNRWWSRDDQHRLKWTGISIPRADITLAMGFVEGVDAWVSPVDGLANTKDTRKVGSFYFDLAEIQNGKARSPFEGLPYDRVVKRLEQAGTRPPSVKELLYLQTAFLGAASSVPPASVRLPSGKTVQGLFEPPFEWASTKMVGGTGQAVPFAPARWVGAGEPALTVPQAQARIVLQMVPESTPFIPSSKVPVLGRGIRSHRPRTRPEDF